MVYTQNAKSTAHFIIMISTNKGLSGIAFFPGSWVSLCLPFLNLPKAKHLLFSSMHNWGKKAGCHFCELAAVERGENDAIIRKVVWVVKPGPYEGQVAGIACTSADVPWCHSTSTAEWITQQMFNVKARLSRQPNTHMHAPAMQRYAYTLYNLLLH